MESLRRLRRLQMVYFFTVDSSLAVIFFVSRLIVVIFTMLLFCGEIQTFFSQNSHEHKKLIKMRVVKDIFKPSFGRPFFVCSDKENPCSLWQWGDVIRPQCYHGIQCSTRKVKKESANHGRLFDACSKGKDDSCGYFEWHDKKEDEDPFEAFFTVYFSNPPSYGYTVKETGEKFTSRHENIIATKLT